MGMSRGSELAFLAGALLDDIAAVVTFAPSGVSWSGFGAKGPVDAPAWTYRGDKIPYVRPNAMMSGPMPSGSRPAALLPLFERDSKTRKRSAPPRSRWSTLTARS